MKDLDYDDIEEMKRLLILAIPERKQRSTVKKKEKDNEEEEEKDTEDSNSKVKRSDINSKEVAEKGDKEVEVISCKMNVKSDDKMLENPVDKMLECDVAKVVKMDKKDQDNHCYKTAKMVKMDHSEIDHNMAEKPLGDFSPKSEILNPLAMDLGELLTPRPSKVGLLGYPDQSTDHFGGARNQMDIAGRTEGHSIGNDLILLHRENPDKIDHMVNELGSKNVVQRPLLRTLDYIINDDVIHDSRSAKIGQIGPKIDILRKKFENLSEINERKIRQNLSVKNFDGKAGLRSALDENVVHTPPRPPLLRYMQSNEKKWAENFKKKKEESSLKKLKKKEKEAKFEADNIKRKGLQKIQVLFDKMMSPKGLGKSDTKTCPETRNITLEMESNVSLVSQPSTLVPSCDQVEVNSVPRQIEKLKLEEKGRLQSERIFTNFGSESKVVDSNQSFEVQKGHTISTQERARNFKEKIAVFEVQSDQNRVKYEAVRKSRKGGPHSS